MSIADNFLDRKNVLRGIIATSIGIVLIALFFVYTGVSVSDLYKFELHIGYVGGYLLTILVYTLMRALRLRLMLELSRSTRLMGALFTQATVRDLLPGWVSEPALMLLLKRWSDVQFSDSASAIFIYRYVEVIIYTCGFVIAAVYSLNLAPLSVSIAIGIAALVLSVLPPLLRISPSIRRLVVSARERTAENDDKQPDTLNAWGFIRGFMLRFFECSAGITRPALYFQTLLLTVVGTCTRVIGFFCVIRALDPSASFVFCVLVFALQFPISILPVRGIANIGTFEIGWLYALILLGMSDSEAGVLAIQAHAIFLIGTGFKGFCAVLGYPRFRVTGD
jgi:hypothetical protein